MASNFSLTSQALLDLDALLARTSPIQNSTIYALVFVLLLGGFATLGSKRPKNINIPILGTEIPDVKTRRDQYTFNSRAFLTEGYKKVTADYFETFVNVC
jgi:hypothetical protein